MILKNFSINKKTIGMFSFSSNTYFDKAGYKEQCYEDYFYGKDGSVEDALAAIEKETTPVIDGLINGSIDKLTIGQSYIIYRFLCFQELRTQRAVDDINFAFDQMAKTLFKHESDFDNEMLKKVQLNLKEPTAFLLQQAVESMHFVYDLKIKILENQTDSDFIISDHPVQLYNSWAEFHPKFKDYPLSTTGLANKGLKMLMPISPKHVLLLYDKETYKCFSKKGFRHKIVNKKDVTLLNKMQVINASSCIYYLDRTKVCRSFDTYKKLREKAFELSRPKVEETEPRLRADGKMSSLLINKKGDMKFGEKFTFLKIRDHNPYTDYNLAMLPPRSWEVVKEHERMTRKRKREKNV